MNSLIADRAHLMVDNFHKLKSAFKWDSHLIKHFVAMSHAISNRKVDIQNLSNIKNYIKGHSSWTSYFRGTNELLLVNLLSSQVDYQETFDNIKDIYELMKKNGFTRGPYLPMAAYTLATKLEKSQWDEGIRRMMDFYEGMKKNHFWLTSQDDYVYSAVLATSQLDVEETMNKVEKYYSLLNKNGFYKGNDLQTLSHILALSDGDIEVNCNRAVYLYKKLKENKCRLQHNALSTIGLLVLLPQEVDVLVSEIKEVYEYIHSLDGYGFWSLDGSTRTILSSNIVSSYYIDSIKDGITDVAMSNSLIAILIAQEQAAISAACIAAVSASAASSS
ncbi:DUF4003 family protein [Clostridium sp. C8-1-8]|uniref:DUF4003 family protein n=1 Tax=Clostridium sp. C8-1-8 TaxID=2698831 RepID=UPI001FABCD0E|nr:DUF4003 family protein [Clostridium sp. C8-1-8]